MLCAPPVLPYQGQMKEKAPCRFVVGKVELGECVLRIFALIRSLFMIIYRIGWRGRCNATQAVLYFITLILFPFIQALFLNVIKSKYNTKKQ